MQLGRKRTEQQIIVTKTGLSKVTTSSEDISYREWKQVINVGVQSQSLDRNNSVEEMLDMWEPYFHLI